jgi:hypothetical protein
VCRSHIGCRGCLLVLPALDAAHHARCQCLQAVRSNLTCRQLPHKLWCAHTNQLLPETVATLPMPAGDQHIGISAAVATLLYRWCMHARCEAGAACGRLL